MKFRLLQILFAVLLSQATMAQNDSSQQQTYDEIYSYLQTGGSNAYDIVRNLVVINDQSADQIYCVWADYGIPEINQGRFKPNTPQVAYIWEILYAAIRRCNFFLENFTGADETTQQQRAEVRFLRAFFYSIALDMWGGVPLYTSSDASEMKGRNTSAEVFDFIVSELNDCRSSLLAAPAADQYGKPTQSAAQLLLARLYLNAQVYTGTARWAEAKQLAAALIGSESYSLCEDYARLFMGDNNKNGAEREVVWPLVVDPLNQENWGNTTFLVSAIYGYDMPSNGLESTWSGLVVRRSLLQKFFPNDDCPSAVTDVLQAAAGDDRCLFYGVGRPYSSSPYTNFDDGFSCVKYTNLRTDDANPLPIHADTDFPFLRLAEAYLIHAEADARLSGGSCSAEGLQSLNTLRQRAHASALSSADLTTLADEWAREFYLEGRRRSDLVRFGLYSGTSYWWDGKETAHLDLLPIPITEMERNPDCVQNPGYEDITKKPEGLAMDQPAYSGTVVELAKVQGLWLSWQRPTNFEADEPASYILEFSLSEDFTRPFFSSEVEDVNAVLLNTLDLYQHLGYTGVADGETCSLFARVTCRGVTSEPVSFNVLRNQLQPEVRTWHIIGEPIGTDAWMNSLDGLGRSLVPFGVLDSNTFRYAGYFGEGGFKMIHTIGQWEEQIGSYSGSVDDYVFNDGAALDFRLSEPGNYLFTIYEGDYRYMTWERLSDELPNYPTIGLIGGFNGWADDFGMTPVGGVLHTWYAFLALDEATELKFRANNNWDYNWGGESFPYGTGISSGPNISVKAGSYLVFFNDITGDYLFLNAADGQLPSGGGESEQLVDGMYLNTAYATIQGTGNVTFRLEDEGETVQVLDAPEGQRTQSVKLVVGNGWLGVNADGTVEKKHLASWMSQIASRVVETDVVSGKRTTTIQASLRGFCDKDGLRVYTESEPFTITMEEDFGVVVADAYYYVGSLNGWLPEDRSMPLVKQQEGVFSITFTQEAWQGDNWFKVAPSTTTDWNGNFVYPANDGESLGSGSFLTEGNGGAWCIPASDTDKTYTFTIDFTTMTYTLVEGTYTGISERTLQQPSAVYSISGTRMQRQHPTTIYIRNGRKFITK